MSRFPTDRETIASLLPFLATRPAPLSQPHEDPHEIIGRPYGKSVRERIAAAPNLATAEHIYQGAVGGATHVSTGTRRKWDRALEGVRRREAEDIPEPLESEPLVDVGDVDDLQGESGVD